MKFGQQDRPKQRAPRKASGRTVGSLVAHRAFAPILGLWGSMLGGLTIMVLPSALIEQALSGTMIGASGLPVQPIAAAIAALLLGGLYDLKPLQKSFLKDENTVLIRGAVMDRNTGRHPILGLNRDRKGGGVLGAIVDSHWRQAQLARAIRRNRQTDQAARMFGHEIDLLRRRHLSRNDHIPLIFAVFGIDKDIGTPIAGVFDNVFNR